MMILIPLHYYFNEEFFDKEPAYMFKIPYLGSFGIINLRVSFWIKSFIFLSLQSFMNLCVATFVYRFILVTRPSTSLPSSNPSPCYSYLIGYGLVCPILLLAPFYIVTHCVELKNVALIICLCGGLPTLLLLRVVEAIHGLVPPAFLLVDDDVTKMAETHVQEGNHGDNQKKASGRGKQKENYNGFKRFILYYAATLQVKIDQKTNQPVRFTRQIMISQLRSFFSIFLQTSILYSLLQPFDYAIAPSRRPIQNLADLYYWGNIVNAFAMASLTSLLLNGGASGLGLMTSFCSGLTMENFSASPLTQSSSPSDFWGNRWDRPVASALRRGAYRPLLQAGYSRLFAAMVTFSISGLIHEYILLLVAQRKGTPKNNEHNLHSEDDDESYQPKFGNQFLFFVWNGIALCLERLFMNTQQGRLFSKWTRSHVPKPIRTALVLLTVLPIAHLFTDEYVKGLFYDDAAHGFPRIKYFGQASP
uniref:Wax synthase domain-containing protein n=1 Tax=Pseudo-nitzschia australis TaxID=44445 RepID=A0A7S4AXF0_9STRA